MKKVFGIVGLVLVSLMVGGCIDTATLLTVKKDGSGTLMLRVYVSKDAMKQAGAMGGAMMGEMMGGMVEGMGGDGADATEIKMEIAKEMAGATKEPKVYDEAKLKMFAKVLGPGVAFSKGHEIKRKSDGWPGFIAYYDVEDVTKIKLNIGIGDTIVSMMQMPGGGAGDEEMEMDTPGYKFAITKGAETQLDISYVEPEDASGGEGDDEADMEEDMGDLMGGEEGGMGDLGAMMGGGGGGDAMAKQMEAQMMAMFKGKKESIMVYPAGTITSCNAKYRAGKGKSVITLLAIDYEKLMADKKNFALLDSVDGPADLADKNIPGLQVESADKVITTKFK